MTKFYKLNNEIKHYTWGSAQLIPDFLGLERDGSPWAELWMGAHPGTSSHISLGSGSISLFDYITRNPRHCLGKKTAQNYNSLPFLFKLLAAEQPLSIQAHPNLSHAQVGFDRENQAGVALEAPNRSYKDPNHKPEIVCALTPFTGMCGFRHPYEIRHLLSLFLKQPYTLKPGAEPLSFTKQQYPSSQPVSDIINEAFTPLLEALELSGPAEVSNALRNFFIELFSLSIAAREALTEYILSYEAANNSDPQVLETCEWRLMSEFARQYPEDPSIIAPLYLNVFHLEPGEAVFLKAGVLHSYIKGFALELMANSDNVLRGGLTKKHTDILELMNILDFTPHKPEAIKPLSLPGTFIYPSPCGEFSLTRIKTKTDGTSGNDEQGKAELVLNGPVIGIVTEGEATINDTILKKGESVFFPFEENQEPVTLRGNFTFHAASSGNIFFEK